MNLSSLLSISIFAFVALNSVSAQFDDQLHQTGVEYTRFQPFAFGGAFGLNYFTGDVQDQAGSMFESVKNRLLLGGDAIAKYRVGGIEDIGTLHAVGKAGFHPIDADLLQGEDSYMFENNVLLFSLGAQLELLPQLPVRPFAGVGFGFLLHDPQVTTSGKWDHRYDRFKGNGTSTFAMPIDVGVLFSVSSYWDVMIFANKTIALSDNLDGWDSNVNDNWQSFNLGLLYYFGDPNPIVVEEILRPSN